jgi:putative addiction module component (TIGR02574 family)
VGLPFLFLLIRKLANHAILENTQYPRLQMNKAFEQLKSQTIALSAPERAELVEFLLDSLDPFDKGVKGTWHLEIKRRLAEIHHGNTLDGNTVGKPAEEVLADLRLRYP